MSRHRMLLGFVVVLVPVIALAALALAARSSGSMAEGTNVGGVDVSGLSRADAAAKVRAQVTEPAANPVTVSVGERVFRLSTDKAGLAADVDGAVRRAYEEGREGSFLSRGWRKLTGGSADVAEPLPLTVARRAVRGFVGQVHSYVARKPKDASLDIAVDRVRVKAGVVGKRLAGRDDLVTRISQALVLPGGERSFRARTADVQPKVTRKKLFDRTPVVVTVDRSGKRARVFRRGEVVKSYTVAVGEPKYPTPTGTFTVQSKQVDPVWNVPDSEWAGELAGQTIPGGDPRNPLIARWIGFNGSVGFHGTSSIGSLGTAASHGCVRMNPSDVKDLYERVEVGTPVMVAA